jgi:hypothetical protein
VKVHVASNGVRSLNSALLNPLTGKRRVYGRDFPRLKSEIDLEEYIGFETNAAADSEHDETRFDCCFCDYHKPSLYVRDDGKWGTVCCGILDGRTGDVFDFAQRFHGISVNQSFDYIEALVVRGRGQWRDVRRTMRAYFQPTGRTPAGRNTPQRNQQWQQRRQWLLNDKGKIDIKKLHLKAPFAWKSWCEMTDAERDISVLWALNWRCHERRELTKEEEDARWAVFWAHECSDPSLVTKKQCRIVYWLVYDGVIPEPDGMCMASWRMRQRQK